MRTRITIKKYVIDETLSWEEKYKQLEAHHNEETKFLIGKIQEFEDQTKADDKGEVHCYCCDNSP